MYEQYGGIGGYEEHGMHINPDPENNYSFVEGMLPLCNNTFVVSEKIEDDINFPDQDIYRLEDENGDTLNFYFHEWMFDEVDSEEQKDIDPEYQIDFLFA